MRGWSTHRKLLFLAGASGGSAVEDTATGNPVSFVTDIAKPLHKLLCAWTPTQSGTGDPAPDNVRPITGMDGVTVWHTGVNVFDGEFESGMLDNSGAEKPSSSNIRSKNYISVVPGKNYKVVYTKTNVSITNMDLFYYDENKGFVSSAWKNPVEITIPSGVYWMRFYMDGAYSAGTDRDVSFNYPSTDTEYHAYTGTTYAVEFPALGKNLCPPVVKGVGINNTNGAEKVDNTSATTDYIPVSFANGTQYFMSGIVYNLSSFVSAYNSSKEYLGRTSATSRANLSITSDIFTGGTPQGTGDIAYIRLTEYEGNTGNSIDLVDNAHTQLEKGSTATAYEPYTTTVYGGTLDLTTGVLTAEWNGFRKTWGDGESATDMGNDIIRKIYPMVDYLTTGINNNMCNIAPYNSSEVAYTHFYYSGQGETNRRCRLFLPSDTPDSTEVVVITKLSRPFVVATLTPTQVTALIGNNTIWSDANGDCEVKYLKKG